MAYYMRERYAPDGSYRHGMLVEMTHAEVLRESMTRNAGVSGEPQTYFRKVDAGFAHRWVKDGLIHETTLWVDEGKIRKA